MRINIQETFLLLETFERGLNLIGYIPFVGTRSAQVRNVFAAIEGVSGVVFVALSLEASVQGHPNRLYSVLGETLIGHSILNMIRSYVETIHFVPLVTTLPYDVIGAQCVGGRFFCYMKPLSEPFT